MIKKNKDYGDMNVIELGEEGIVYRIHDKTTRLLNIVKNKKKPANETIEDTYIDLAGYAILGLMVKRKKFQKK